ncbi:MAG: NAD(P)-dependent alcohol dehydrogenase [Spirochaetaceae bacterium]|nr:MAG: NAD(P)-dependent alcohol dehydrogenase [Spirochaetaceae bacterium]
MKAIVHTAYGPADELRLKEVRKPVPKDNEVLIKIIATTVTTTDCNVRNFTFVPKLFLLPARLIFGMRKPRINILGIDLAGEIEAAGKNVTRFKVGDRVFGTQGTVFGCHAEYTCVPEHGVLAKKPDNLSFEEAASVFLAGSTALYYIRDLAEVRAGQKILIIGASGAIGTYSVQLAKYYGTEVTGVCSGANAALVRSLGADKVIDYTDEDHARKFETYDVVFDVVGKTSFARSRHLLKKGGMYLVNLITGSDLLHMLFPFLRKGRKIKGGSAPERAEDLNYLKKLLEEGRIKPVIDGVYPLEKTAEAFKYVESGHKKGTVVITIP